MQSIRAPQILYIILIILYNYINLYIILYIILIMPFNKYTLIFQNGIKH